MRKYYEWVIETLISLSGIASIVFVLLICFFVLKEGLMLFRTTGVFDFIFGTRWYPISEPPRFGILPLILGSLWVTAGATVISVPFGIACAIFIGEIASGWLRETLKAGVELLAAIPSIVLGFVGLVTLVPLVKKTFGLPTGLTALSGAVMLAFMAMPAGGSIIEEAPPAVPRGYRGGFIALGAAPWPTL